MANIIKNFGLEGVGSSVQFGKGGARLVQTDGQFSAKDASNGSFVRFAIANAVEGSDAVTFEQMNAAVLAVSGDNEALELKVDEVIASVGLEADGSLQLAAGNYLADAANVVDALGALDAAVKAEADARAAALSDEANARVLADTALAGRADALEANVATLQSEIDAVEGRALALENNAVAQQQAIEALQVSVGDDSRLNALEGNVATLQGDVDAVEGRALVLEGNVASLESDIADLDAAVIKKDGSVAYTADQSMGGFKLTNVAAPVANGDAANKQYVDSVVGNLGNAFNYVGTLEGGADEASAFDVATLPEGGKDAGDYYKVVEAGWIKLGAQAEFFNTNDGLVLNSVGGFDKIDNTDAVSRGTVGQIAVTGSVDTGFDIAIDAAYTAARQQEVLDEANARALAISTLESTTTANAIAQQAAIAAVEGRATALEADVLALEGNAAAQQSAIEALQTSVGDDSRLVAVEGRATALEGNVALLQAEDIALDGRLDVLEANAVAQQSAIEALAGDLQNLSQDTLTSAGEVYTIHAADTHAEIAAAGSSTKIEMTAASGEVVIAASDAEGDADLRLVAAGEGSVVIGEAGDGFLQAEDGYNMTVAGGDNGGNLTLKGSIVNVESDNGALVIDGSSIAAEGAAADIDLVFAAKGAGAIDMSGAQVVNVANAVAASDAINKSQLDAAIADLSDAVVASESGHVAVVRANITNAAGKVDLGQVSGTLMSIRVVVGTAYTAGAAKLNIEYDAGAGAVALADQDVDFDKTETGVYIVELGGIDVADAVISVDVEAHAAGAAKVFVEYIKA